MRFVVCLLSLLFPVWASAANAPGGRASLCEAVFETLDTRDPLSTFDHLESRFLYLESAAQSKAVVDGLGKDQAFELEIKFESTRKDLGRIETGLAAEHSVPLKDFARLQRNLLFIRAAIDAVSEKPAPQGSLKPRPIIEITTKAQKEIAGLQPIHREKYLRFIDEIIRLGGIHNLSARWSLERIQFEPSLRHAHSSGHAYSVRLNDNYRVLFQVAHNGHLNVIRVSKDVTHRN